MTMIVSRKAGTPKKGMNTADKNTTAKTDKLSVEGAKPASCSK